MKLNSKSKLFVIREAPQTLFPKIFKAWKISHLVFEKDTDAYGRERDEKVMELAKKAGVEVIRRSGRTLYDSDEVVKANGGKPTMSMSAIQNVHIRSNVICRGYMLTSYQRQLQNWVIFPNPSQRQSPYPTPGRCHSISSTKSQITHQT